MQSVLASDYIDIPNRGEDVEEVRKELGKAINGKNRCQSCLNLLPMIYPLAATSTSIHPTERERFLDALLLDLEDVEGSLWLAWPEDSESASWSHS